MTDKGSETLEQRAQAWRERLAGKTLYNEKIDEEVAEFARTVAREHEAFVRRRTLEEVIAKLRAHTLCMKGLGSKARTTSVSLMAIHAADSIDELADELESELKRDDSTEGV